MLTFKYKYYITIKTTCTLKLQAFRSKKLQLKCSCSDNYFQPTANNTTKSHLLSFDIQNHARNFPISSMNIGPIVAVWPL